MDVFGIHQPLPKHTILSSPLYFFSAFFSLPLFLSGVIFVGASSGTSSSFCSVGHRERETDRWRQAGGAKRNHISSSSDDKTNINKTHCDHQLYADSTVDASKCTQVKDDTAASHLSSTPFRRGIDSAGYLFSHFLSLFFPFRCSSSSERLFTPSWCRCPPLCCCYFCRCC